MATLKEKDAVIAKLRSKIKSLEEELKTNVQGAVEFTNADLEDAMGVYKDSNGDYQIAQIAFNPETNQALVVSYQNCGKDLAIFRYNCKKKLAIDLILKYTK